jgi:hypothetical protein
VISAVEVVHGVPILAAFRESEREQRDDVEVSISSTIWLVAGREA